MTATDYTMTLRHQGRAFDHNRVPPFSRGLDFGQILDADRLLLQLLIAAVRRAGHDPKKDLDEFDLEIREYGNGRPLLRTFAASRAEVTDDMLR